MKRKLIASLICGALLTSTASVSAMTAETELKLETMAYFKPVYDTLKEQQIRFDYELEHGNPYDAKDILAAMQASVANLRNDITSQQLDSDIQTAQMKLIETELKMRNSFLAEFNYSKFIQNVKNIVDSSSLITYDLCFTGRACNLTQEISSIHSSLLTYVNGRMVGGEHLYNVMVGYFIHNGFTSGESQIFLLKLFTESEREKISLQSDNKAWEDLGYELPMVQALRNLFNETQSSSGGWNSSKYYMSSKEISNS